MKVAKQNCTAFDIYCNAMRVYFPIGETSSTWWITHRSHGVQVSWKTRSHTAALRVPRSRSACISWWYSGMPGWLPRESSPLPCCRGACIRIDASSPPGGSTLERNRPPSLAQLVCKSWWLKWIQHTGRRRKRASIRRRSDVVNSMDFYPLRRPDERTPTFMFADASQVSLQV